MANPPVTSVQSLLPVQAYFDVDGNFQTFIGQGQPFYATANPQQSGLNITSSTINSTTIGATTPSTGVFTNIATTTGTITTAPSGATDIANKQYVDYYAAGLSWKQPVKASSLSNIASLSGFQTVDTVPLTNGDRVLVKDQSLSKDNGIYVVRTGAWEYAVGADNWEEYVGAIVFVEEGSQAYTAWYSLAQEGGTLGVTALNWANFSVATTYSAGTGLTLFANVFSITNTGVINATYGSASKTVTLAINAQGQATSASQQDIAIAATQITSGTIDSARLSGSYTGITGLGTLTDLTVTNPIVGSITGNAATATSLGGGTTGSIPYQSAVGTTSFLGVGSNNQILTLIAGLPSWQNAPSTGVTSVTASSPLSSSGGATPNISITQSSGSSDGYLSSANWTTFNNKANSGTNSDITSMTGLTGGISSPDFIYFDTAYATTLTAGRLGWDSTNNSLAYGMAGGNIVQHIGEDQYLYIKASATITKGQVIMFTGSVGASGVLTGAPATGITDGTYIMGVAAEAIANNAFGFVQTFGVLTNVNTAAFSDGDLLWYDPTVAGGLTATKPSAPNVKAQVAACNKGGSAGGGVITVRVNPGSALGGTDSNVQLSSPTGGQILSYNQTAQYWSNISLTAGSGISITPTTGGAITIASTVTSGLTITDDTTTNSDFYATFTSATSGTISGANTSSTKFKFKPSTGTLTTVDAIFNGTTAVTLPSGTTGQRPSSPTNGMLRFNTTIGAAEVYSATNGWEVLNTYTVVPGAPTIGTATATSSTSATVTYTAPASNGGSVITSYTAVASPGGQTGTVSQSGSGTITVTGLTTGTAYTFTVFATNLAGDSPSSAASNSITTWSVPGAPTIGTATPTGGTTATVAYTAPASNGGTAITSYTAVSSPGGLTGTLSQAGSGTITVTGLTSGVSYTFTVFATNAVGNSAASAASNSITTFTVPGAPTIGTATATSATTATVSYTAPASNGGSVITSYTATSSPGGITGSISQAGSGTITVSGLSGGTSYTFTVTATNAVGTSAASAASNSITTPNPTSSINYLIVAGGGAGCGGGNSGGGGGAGGYLAGSSGISTGTSYTVTVGGGGAGSTANANGANGSNSSISGINTATGGGGGGTGQAASGNSGGSGGGGGGNVGTQSGGAGTGGQGNAGGSGGGGSPYGAGGGGGASAVGGNGPASGGAGGSGTYYSVTGAYYAGGGGGGGSVQGAAGGAGGIGGGGSANSGSATANTGGGGGGGINSGAPAGGSGGSGIVIISYSNSFADAVSYSGASFTNSGGNKIYTFTSSGSIVF